MFNCPDISYDVTKDYKDLLKTYPGATHLCKRPLSDYLIPVNDKNECVYPADCDSYKILGKAIINIPGNLVNKTAKIVGGVTGASTVGLVGEVANSVDNIIKKKDISNNAGKPITNAYEKGSQFGDNTTNFLPITFSNPRYGKKSKAKKGKAKKSKAKKGKAKKSKAKKGKAKKSMAKKGKW